MGRWRIGLALCRVHVFLDAEVFLRLLNRFSWGQVPGEPPKVEKVAVVLLARPIPPLARVPAVQMHLEAVAFPSVNAPGHILRPYLLASRQQHCADGKRALGQSV